MKALRPSSPCPNGGRPRLTPSRWCETRLARPWVFNCLCESTNVPETILRQDPVVYGWLAHLRDEPLPKNETALFLRRWLSEGEGEQPSPIQAACWLDIKRTYLALRPKLRRVYLTLQDIGPYATAAQTLGFVPVPSANVNLDGRTYYTAMLDFGPSSVDGWLARLVGGARPNWV
jgi:hypothetical protein